MPWEKNGESCKVHEEKNAGIADSVENSVGVLKKGKTNRKHLHEKLSVGLIKNY